MRGRAPSFLSQPAHPHLIWPRIPLIKNPHLRDRVISAGQAGGHPFRHRVRRSRRRGHSVHPTASSYREAAPDPFTTRAALIGSRRELHPLPDDLGRGRAVDLLPCATVGFLNPAQLKATDETQSITNLCYGRALYAFVLNHGWVTASCHRANLERARSRLVCWANQ
jgi:hypothetical protein